MPSSDQIIVERSERRVTRTPIGSLSLRGSPLGDDAPASSPSSCWAKREPIIADAATEVTDAAADAAAEAAEAAAEATAAPRRLKAEAGVPMASSRGPSRVVIDVAVGE